uniref:Vitellogenin domain-containing protein n=1 Tax=Ciona savignyi TaxID=51511 RepID=H2ZAA5_CIOSA
MVKVLLLLCCLVLVLKLTMAVHTDSAEFVVLFSQKCVPEKVPNEFEWNGKQKELSTSLIRNSELTDQLKEYFVNKGGIAAAMCFIMYKLYPRLHTYNFKTTSGGRSLHFKVRTFALEFRRIKVKLQDGSLANEVHKEAHAQFPNILNERGLQIKFELRENSPEEKSKLPTNESQSSKQTTGNIHGFYEHATQSSEHIKETDKSATDSNTHFSETNRTGNIPSTSGAWKKAAPTSQMKFNTNTAFTTEFSKSESTFFESPENDLHQAIEEEDANTLWVSKKFQSVIPLFERMLQRTERGHHKGIMMLKLALCKLKQSNDSSNVGADLFIKGYKEIENDPSSDHTTACQLSVIAKTYAVEDFPRRSYLIFICAARLLQRSSLQRKLRSYMELLSNITPLERIPNIRDRIIEIASSILKECNENYSMEADAVRSLCATTIANSGNHIQASVIFDQMLDRLRPTIFSDDGTLALFCQCLYGQTLNQMNIGNRSAASKHFKEYEEIINKVRSNGSPMTERIIDQFESAMQAIGRRL